MSYRKVPNSAVSSRGEVMLDTERLRGSSRRGLAWLDVALAVTLVTSFGIGCGGGGASSGAASPVASAATNATIPSAGASAPVIAAAGSGSTLTPTMPVQVAGAGAPAAAAPAAAPAAFCAALGVIRNKCQTCHSAQRMFGAPMSLVTYDDLQKPAVTDPSKKVYQLVSARIHDATHPMPPINNPTLDASELAKMDGWIAGGALPGADPTCPNLAAAPTPTQATSNPAGAAPPNTTPDADGYPWPNDCEKHYKLLIYSGTQGAGQKMSVAASMESHPQVSITPPWKGDVQALAFKPITDNAKVLHHWILYAPDGTFIMGWAPGNTGSQPLPDDVGVYLPSSGNMRMDVHYNNLGGNSVEQDASGVEVCTIETPSKFRKNLASVQGVMGNANVPAHQHVDNTTTCTVKADMGSATILANSPHMHKLGTHAKFVLTQGGMDTVLRDAPFSFEDQRSYNFTPPVVVKSGDKLTVTCSFTNDTNKAVGFGENTEDEMCFNFILVYPRGHFSCGTVTAGFPMFGGN
jgi:hypothetical protein